MDFILERWQANPGMHIYHYSPYEPAAVKRLTGRHGTREIELDRLLQGGAVRRSLGRDARAVQASVESYSLKALEPFDRFVPELSSCLSAAAALRRIARALELTGAADITTADRAAIEAYNRDDCLSTAALRDWLERRERGAGGPGSPPGEPARRCTRSGRGAGRRGAGGLSTGSWTRFPRIGAHGVRRSARGGSWPISSSTSDGRTRAPGGSFSESTSWTPRSSWTNARPWRAFDSWAPSDAPGACPSTAISSPTRKSPWTRGTSCTRWAGKPSGRCTRSISRSTLDIIKKGRTIQIHPAAVMVERARASRSRGRLVSPACPVRGRDTAWRAEVRIVRLVTCFWPILRV